MKTAGAFAMSTPAFLGTLLCFSQGVLPSQGVRALPASSPHARWSSNGICCLHHAAALVTAPWREVPILAPAGRGWGWDGALQGHYTHRSSAHIHGAICKSCSCPPARGRGRGLRGWVDSQSVRWVQQGSIAHPLLRSLGQWCPTGIWLIAEASLPPKNLLVVFVFFFSFSLQLPSTPHCMYPSMVQSWGCACNFGEGERNSTCAFPLCLWVMAALYLGGKQLIRLNEGLLHPVISPCHSALLSFWVSATER